MGVVKASYEDIRIQITKVAMHGCGDVLLSGSDGGTSLMLDAVGDPTPFSLEAQSTRGDRQGQSGRARLMSATVKGGEVCLSYTYVCINIHLHEMEETAS